MQQVLLEKLTVSQLVKKFSAFYGTRSSLCHSQDLATCPYPEAPRSNPYPHIQRSEILLNIIIPSKPGSSKWSLSFRFPHQHPVYTSSLPIRATCPSLLILIDLISRKILREGYRSLSSSLYSVNHSPVTPSLLGSNIPHSALFQTPSAYVPPSTSGTKFHNHTKQQAQL